MEGVIIPTGDGNSYMVISEEQIDKETRRAVLTGYAKQLGIYEQLLPTDNIGQIKSKIMAVVVPVRPPTAPAKPAPRPIVPAPAPKAVAAPAAPIKAAPASAPKAAPAPIKAPAPKAAPAAKASPPAAEHYVTKTAFEAFQKELEGFATGVQEALEAVSAENQALKTKLAAIEAVLGNQFVSTDENGQVVLDIENADENSLRDWAHQYNVCDHTAAHEDIRNALMAHATAPGFTIWAQVNSLPRPAGETTAAPEAAEEEEQTITADDVNKMNWDALTQLCDQAGISYADISSPKQPKVLRNRIIEALSQAEAGEEAPAESNGAIEPGTVVTFENEGTQYTAQFVGLDADGDYVVQLEDGQQVAVPAGIIQLA